MSQRSLREKLCGIWLLEQFIDVSADGTLTHTLGENAAGYISYGADGWVSVQIMAADRVHFANPDITGGTQEQLARAAASYFAYAGRYETDDARQTVTHHLNLCLIPNWVGSRQLRHVQFSENDALLTLKSDPMIFDGIVHNPELRWRRRVK